MHSYKIFLLLLLTLSLPVFAIDTSSLIKAPAGVAIIALHFDQMLLFYQALGFKVSEPTSAWDSEKVAEAYGLGRGEGREVVLRHPVSEDFYIELEEFVSPVSLRPPNRMNDQFYHHLSLGVSDLSALSSLLPQYQGSLVGLPSDIKGRQQAYYADPDGNLLLFYQTSAEQASSGMPVQKLGPLAVSAEDNASLAAFYSKYFGLNELVSQERLEGSSLDRLTQLHGAEVVSLTSSKQGFAIDLDFLSFLHPEGHRQAMDSTSAMISRWAFQVKDIHRAVKLFSSQGIMSFISEPVEYGKCTFVFGKDPEGNIVELFEPKLDLSLWWDVLIVLVVLALAIPLVILVYFL